MIDTLSDLRHALQGSPLAGRNIATLCVPDSPEVVFAIDVNGIDALQAWQRLRSLSAATGRWPVLTMLDTSDSGSWDTQVRAEELFSRFYFEEERRDARLGDSPADIIAAAAGLDIAEQFATFRADTSLTIEEALDIALEETLSQYGKAPSIGDPQGFLARESIATFKALEKWFLQWELAHCAEPLRLPEHGLSHIEWFEPRDERQALLLMPSLRGWETPAYLNWYASYLCNSQFIVALLRQWHEKYGAQLVAHYGTMLHLTVSRRPSSIEEAFELAWQQETISPCTTILAGVSLRNHARALLHTDRWFLHERP